MLAVLTAVTVVMAMRIVGVLLVAALMVLPVATSRLARALVPQHAVRRGRRGRGVGRLGLFAARQWALAAGGAIVLVAAALFALGVDRRGRPPRRRPGRLPPRRPPLTGSHLRLGVADAGMRVRQPR